ncbi:hypothetical protein ANRL1_00326 [Anaerolineae bacterium]|nr:hypothetical protein ANRL1_00326 [Anaerolineae bacterium]
MTCDVNPTIQPSNHPTTKQPNHQTTHPATRALVLFIDRLAFFISRRWLWLASGFLTLYILVPMLAPVLMHYGYQTPAEWIYNVYGFNCHQLSTRSYFLFGGQTVYTLDDLHALVPGTAAEGSVSLVWRDFRGNSQLGYKVAICERDIAIYGAMVLGGLIFGLLRTRLKPLDWRVWLICFVAPMAFDGGTQLIGLRESNYIFRTITGALFGLGSVWLAYPYVETAMRDLQAQAQTQWERAHARVTRDE